MTIDKAVGQVIKEWQKAEGNEDIKDSVAYALYQVWKQADKEAQRKDRDCIHCVHHTLAGCRSWECNFKEREG